MVRLQPGWRRAQAAQQRRSGFGDLPSQGQRVVSRPLHVLMVGPIVVPMGRTVMPLVPAVVPLVPLAAVGAAVVAVRPMRAAAAAVVPVLRLLVASMHCASAAVLQHAAGVVHVAAAAAVLPAAVSGAAAAAVAVGGAAAGMPFLLRRSEPSHAVLPLLCLVPRAVVCALLHEGRRRGSCAGRDHQCTGVIRTPAGPSTTTTVATATFSSNRRAGEPLAVRQPAEEAFALAGSAQRLHSWRRV